MSRFVVAMSGASGAIYGLRLISALAQGGHQLDVVISRAARGIIRDETGLALLPARATEALRRYAGGGDITVHPEHDLYAPIASGSVPTAAMVVVPCSMKTLSAIAHGHASSLLERAADVHMKEGRPLILVPRETPLSVIHLENMLTLARVPRVRIVPAMPAFYSHPRSIDALVDFIVARILDNLGLDNNLSPRWPGGHSTPQDE